MNKKVDQNIIIYRFNIIVWL